MRVLVTGVTGQLGYDVCKVLAQRGVDHIGVSSAEFDVADREAVREAILRCRPDAVIHCAAWTAVDAAEDEAERAMEVNAVGARNVALACRETDAAMVYVSTDYVFSGEGEQYYEPEDETGPVGMYGRTKLEGERAVREILERYFVVRVSWLFGSNGKNFVKTMLRLAETRDEVSVVCDQVGSPTYAADLARLLCDMIETERYGVYHATNEGVCSWAEFAEEIFRRAGKSVRVRHISSEEYVTRATRPKNSRLSKRCLAEAGFETLPPWQDALSRYLAETGYGV